MVRPSWEHCRLTWYQSDDHGNIYWFSAAPDHDQGYYSLGEGTTAGGFITYLSYHGWELVAVCPIVQETGSGRAAETHRLELFLKRPMPGSEV